MQTECSPKPSEFARVEGRPVVAAFDGGALTSQGQRPALRARVYELASRRPLTRISHSAGCIGAANQR